MHQEISKFTELLQPGVKLGLHFEATAEPNIYRALVNISCTHAGAKDALKAKNITPEFLRGTIEEIVRDMTSGAKLARIQEKIRFGNEAAAKDSSDKEEKAKTAATKATKEKPAPKTKEAAPAETPATKATAPKTAEVQTDLFDEAEKAEAVASVKRTYEDEGMEAAHLACEKVVEAINAGNKTKAEELVDIAQAKCREAAGGVTDKTVLAPLVDFYKSLRPKIEKMQNAQDLFG